MTNSNNNKQTNVNLLVRTLIQECPLFANESWHALDAIFFQLATSNLKLYLYIICKLISEYNQNNTHNFIENHGHLILLDR